MDDLSFNTLFDASADALLLVNDTGNVMLANPEAQQLLGYSAEEFVGLCVEDLMPARYRAGHQQFRAGFFVQPVKRPMGNSQALVALDRNGAELAVEISLTPLQSKGGPCVLITFCDASRHRKTEDALHSSEERLEGILQDITAHKALEGRLRARRMERETLLSQQVAIQTASAIAHEINQPLTAISAYCEVALCILGKDVAHHSLRHALQGCVDQAQLAGQSLHELLDFLHAGEVVLESLDLNSIVCEALAITQNDGFGGFQPVLELEQDMPPVSGNRIQIQKVMVNLLRNGVEAMREAGVPASSIMIKVQTVAGNYMAMVTVQDSGPGLTPEAAQRAFEPFFTTKSSGIGLGLAISRSLIEANGGQLWIDPEAGPGAIFHFTLPFAA